MATSLITRDVEFTTLSVDARGEVVNRRVQQMHESIEALGDGLILEMLAVPGGAFLMGSTRGQGYDDERPQHRITVAPFWMGKFPITQAQWQSVMGPHTGRFSGARCPVESVSWEQARRFCERLTKRTGRAYHLPSEARWEYACRAGTETPFYFGETLTTELANYNGEFTYRNEPKGVYRHVTTDVGSFPPNAFGLHDMHGNVWEWCADPWHDSYGGAPTDGRIWLAGGDEKHRVARGGCWHDTPDVCRSAARLKLRADEGDEFVGFRVVMS
jgi:formylglycine-generating enzyme required for sulfatase activity